MPKTKFQDFVFTIIMVVVMVYALVVYNISIDMGGLTNKVFVIAFQELIIMGIIAFVLEFVFVGALTKKIAFRIVTPGKDKPFFITLAISAITVCLMCPLMSLCATLLFKGIDIEIISKWIQTTIINFPMALCWQLFAAGPLVRWIFNGIFNRRSSIECATEAA